MATRSAESGGRYRTISLIILAVLGTIAALYFMKAILIPVTLAVVLACMLSPATTFLRRVLPLSPTGTAAVLFLLTLLFGLYLTSLTAESLVQATINLPLDIASLSLRASDRIRDLVRDKPSLKFILPEPGTINELGESNRRLLSQILTFGLADLSGWVAQGLIVLILVLFLLAESEMLTPKVVRFFARTPGEAAAAERTLKDLTRQIRSFLMTRTLINLGLGLIFAFFLWRYNVRSPFLLGLFAGLTNFVPYLGQLLGGGLPFLVTLAQYESLGDALIVASVFLGLVTIEGYVITPYILGRSLDLNGTVILIACLFWGFLWGLVGLILAMPITACIKLVCQNIPELHRWADLMSRDWQPPPAAKDDLELTREMSPPMTLAPTRRLTEYANCAGCAGKIPPLGIAQILGSLVPRSSDPNLLVGTETSDDAGVYLVADGLAVVQTIDFFPPLVDDPFTFGQIAATNALSDVYAMNGRPITAMNVVMFPDDELPLSILGEILRGGGTQVARAGAVTLGGHSLRDKEIKFGLSVTGLVNPDALLTNSKARIGDVLVLTKPLGTGLVTTAHKKQQCPIDVLDRAVAGMTQLNAVGRDALNEAGGAGVVSAVTDVTGFGLAGHALEMAEGSGRTIEIEVATLPLIEGTEPLAEANFFTRASKTNREFVGDRLEVRPGVNDFRLQYLFDAQTSGGLLIAIHPDHVSRLVEGLKARGALASSVVGRVLERQGAVALIVV